MALRIINSGQRGQPRTLKIEADLRLLTDIPPAPPYFSPDRVAIWKEYAGHLIARGDLSQADLATLENFCMALGDYREFTEVLQRDGYVTVNAKGEQRPHPMCNLRRQAEMQQTVASGLLGLSPRGRSAMRRDAMPDESQPEETKKASTF